MRIIDIYLAGAGAAGAAGAGQMPNMMSGDPKWAVRSPPFQWENPPEMGCNVGIAMSFAPSL